MVEYESMSIPKELKLLITKFINENPEFGYASVSEFLKDAVRDKIVKLKTIK